MGKFDDLDPLREEKKAKKMKMENRQPLFRNHLAPFQQR